MVAINRAVAVAETRGPDAGLEGLDDLADDPRLVDYQPYWAARAGLLARTGEIEAAAGAYERAIGLEADPAVRRFLQRRRAGAAPPSRLSVTRNAAKTGTGYFTVPADVGLQHHQT